MINAKIKVRFDGKCLKQVVMTFSDSNIVNQYTYVIWHMVKRFKH